MHLFGFPPLDPPFDLELLSAGRDEAFPFEELAHFAQLMQWMVTPDNPTKVMWAAKLAVARGYRKERKALTPKEAGAFDAEISAAHFDLRTITFGLLTMPQIESWEDSREDNRADLATAAMIGATLLQLDAHPHRGFGQPSMGKSIFMAGHADDFFDQGVSRHPAKAAWALYAPTVPFALAELWSSKQFDHDHDYLPSQIASFFSPQDPLY